MKATEISQQMTQIQQSHQEIRDKQRTTLPKSAYLSADQNRSSLSMSIPITPNKGDQEAHIVDVILPKKITRQMTKNEFPTTADGQTEPIQVLCKNCQRVNLSRIEREIGLGALQLICLLLLVFFPLAWIPCSVKRFKDTFHYCPYCSCMVGKTHYQFC